MKTSRLIIPPALMVYIIVIYVVLYSCISALNLITFPYNLMGLVIALWGFKMMRKAQKLFRKHQTTYKYDKSTTLITEGPYSQSRNPMYVAMIYILIGLAVFSQNVLSFFFPIIFWAVNHFFNIPQEERWMEETFGSVYRTYKKKVRRWW